MVSAVGDEPPRPLPRVAEPPLEPPSLAVGPLTLDPAPLEPLALGGSIDPGSPVTAECWGLVSTPVDPPPVCPPGIVESGRVDDGEVADEATEPEEHPVAANAIASTRPVRANT